MTVLGLYPLQPFDGVGGHEGVGEVVAAGADVKRLKKGDRVIPLGSGHGTWRDYVVSKEENWHVVSSDLPLADAATLLINPGTALLMLENFVDLKEGDVVIQNGANSEVRHTSRASPACIRDLSKRPVLIPAHKRSRSMLHLRLRGRRCHASAAPSACLHAQRQRHPSLQVGKYVISIAAMRGVKTINIVRDRPNLQDMVKSLKDLGATLVSTPEKVEGDAKAAGLEPILGFQCGA
jgi:Alcohol dehydrogenase GroES-like domain